MEGRHALPPRSAASIGRSKVLDVSAGHKKGMRYGLQCSGNNHCSSIRIVIHTLRGCPEMHGPLPPGLWTELHQLPHLCHPTSSATQHQCFRHSPPAANVLTHQWHLHWLLQQANLNRRHLLLHNPVAGLVCRHQQCLQDSCCKTHVDSSKHAASVAVCNLALATMYLSDTHVVAVS